MRSSFSTILILATSCFAACSTSDGPPFVAVAKSQKVRVTPDVPEPDQASLSTDNATFALKLFAEVKQPDKNVVFSPTSISIALAMTYAGARGETEMQIAKALEFRLPQERLHAAMNWMDRSLGDRGKGAKGADGGPFRLKMVNSLWAQQKDFVLMPAFLDVQSESYGAGVNLVDFQNTPNLARGTINDWVEAQTEERIKNLIPEGVINDRTALVLTNAVYLNAAWKLPFGPNTQEAAFKPLQGPSVNVQMMQQEGSQRAVETADYQAVSLPYEDEHLSMLFVVPNDGMYETFEDSLSATRLADIVSALEEQPVIVNLPRFKFDFPVSLKQALTNLGMPVAFQEAQADFSGISPTPLFIQAVVHKAFIAVAEKGTEAAAATGVVFGRESAPAGLFINANRPFLFFLRDNPTGAILFMGRVLDPSK